MTLITKYRPGALQEVYGNKQTITALEGLINQDEDKPHAYLLSGPSGAGKTTLARIIAAEMDASEMEVHEIDVADFRGVDTIREIRDNSSFAPMVGHSRVWILDEAHKLSTDAQNALLKALEDPPEHVYYVLCTTDPQKLLKTIRTRCTGLKVGPLSEDDMSRLLRHVVKQEGHSLPKKVYEDIIDASEGLPRKALSLLGTVLALEPDQRENAIQGADEEPAEIKELCQALKSNWKTTSAALSELENHDTEAVRRVVLAYFSKVLLSNGKGDDRAAAVLEAFSEPFFNTGFPGLVLAAYTAVSDT